MDQQNQFILTTEQLAQAFGTTVKIISQNFQRHPEDFKENVHYFLLEGDQLQQFLNGQNDILSEKNTKSEILSEKNTKSEILSEKNTKSPTSKIRKLYLWTQKGAFAHAWILKSPGAKAAYEHLIELAEKPQGGISPERYEALQKEKDIYFQWAQGLAAKLQQHLEIPHADDKSLGNESLGDIEILLDQARDVLRKLKTEHKGAKEVVASIKQLEKQMNTLQELVIHTQETNDQADKQSLEQRATLDSITQLSNDLLKLITVDTGTRQIEAPKN